MEILKEIERKLRKEALYLSYKCQDGNLQSVFSCMDIIWTLYDKVINWSSETAQDENRDYFIISKGQATLALYPVLIEKGMFNIEEISSEIGCFDSRYCIQADATKFNGGIENSAGSLGHGLPFAAGIAFANKIKSSLSQVYVLCGDGEFCEGSMWESCLFANTMKLDNLHIIIDDNNSVGKMVNMGSIQDKLYSFGFDVKEGNGHDTEEIEKCLKELNANKNGKPKALIAHTIRGYGSLTMMEKDIWFHKAPDCKELELLCKEVDKF